MTDNFLNKKDGYEFVSTDEFFEEDEYYSEEEKAYRRMEEKNFLKKFVTNQKGYELDWSQY